MVTPFFYVELMLEGCFYNADTSFNVSIFSDIYICIYIHVFLPRSIYLQWFVLNNKMSLFFSDKTKWLNTKIGHHPFVMSIVIYTYLKTKYHFHLLPLYIKYFYL